MHVAHAGTSEVAIFGRVLERRTWKCWPCNLGGDAAELVKLKNGVAFPEAVRIVAELSGIVTPSRRSANPTPRPATAPPASKPAKAASPPPERPSVLTLADGGLSSLDRGRHQPLDARGDRDPGLSAWSR